jgi:hypothetical protein
VVSSSFFIWLFIFFLFGLPVVGMLLKTRSVLSCCLGGGAVAVTPILLLGLFSAASSNNVFGGNVLFDLMLLFAAGAIGGAVFWGIAFSGIKTNYPS